MPNNMCSTLPTFNYSRIPGQLRAARTARWRWRRSRAGRRLRPRAPRGPQDGCPVRFGRFCSMVLFFPQFTAVPVLLRFLFSVLPS